MDSAGLLRGEAKPGLLAFRRSLIAMDTLVSVELPGQAATPGVEQLAESALEWFRTVEAVCSRFDPGSELSRLSAAGGREVVVSELLYRALELALAVARASGGAFDPTVGAAMTRLGFDRHYRTGERVPAVRASLRATYRDVILDPRARSVRLRRPAILDLGAVAKGLALDLAAEGLAGVASYAVFAGGDLRVRGRNAEGERWQIGIRHPRVPGDVIARIAVDEAAVCTSGDYERPGAEPGEHHIVHPPTGVSARSLTSVTVVAPMAVTADSLATAAFVLGPGRALPFLEAQGVEGLVVHADLETEETPGFRRSRR